MFDSNNDYCQECKKWFYAVGEEKCALGCVVLSNKEIRHSKDCIYYKNSLSEMLDNALEEIKILKNKGKKL